MQYLRLIGGVATAVILLALAASADSGGSGRIYGKITTIDGDVFQGLIRWDKNEGNWVDILNGNKELRKKRSDTRDRKKYRDRERSIELFGITIARSGGSMSWSGSAQSGMRFGHLRSLEVIDDDAALLTLKSGEEVELDGGSTDIGDGVREIIIEDSVEGEIELEWEDIERIDFSETDDDLVSNLGQRLYGTITVRRGDQYTGFVCWDVDELFSRDILDGDQKGRRRKVKFAKIKSIERYSSSAATVTLTNGDEMLLRGTNDVDDSNGGIAILDPGLGQVVVDWDEFDRLDFTDIPRGVPYGEFDGGRPLEFGLIKEIKKKSYRSAIVTVWDGRSFRLRGSNDVDEDNKGIFIITSDGEEVEVDWEDFDRVEFAGK